MLHSENNQEYKTEHRKSFRRLFAVLCITTLIGAGSFAATSVNAASTEITANTTAYLNIRSNAGTNYSILQCISKNSPVTILDRINNDWVKVKTPSGLIGYCHADYLDIKTDAKTNTYLNLRQGPGTNYKCVKTIPVNTNLDILRFYNKSWMKVKTPDGTVGYVCTDYDYITFVTNNSKVVNTTSSSKPITTEAPKISAASKDISVGQSFALTASTNSGGTLLWKSSNSNIASVNNKGVITGVKEGTATITVTDNKTSKTAICKVTVSAKKISNIKLQTYSGTLTVGQSLQLSPITDPLNSKVAYKSSASSIATVDSKGIITAKSAGSCNITIYDPNGSNVQAIYKLTVKVKETHVTISASNISIRAGASQKLTASSSDGSKVTWSSSDENIISVRNGVVSALSSGTATITASSGSASTSCKVTVTAVSPADLKLTRTSDTITAGKTLYIQGNSSRKIWWNSSNPEVAVVNNEISTYNKGFIVAKNPGKAAITYTDANGNRAICVVTVTEAEPVRFTYSSPNCAVRNSNVELVAITDKSRTDVYFEINENGKIITVKADKKVVDGDTYVWTGNYYVQYAGTLTYSAYAVKNGKSATCTDGQADIYVSDKTNKATTTLEKLRASDEVIQFIGDKEGFVPCVVPDKLADNIPTLAHGYVVWEGNKFYNNLTRKEGYALLVSAVNKENYAKNVNNMLINNDIKFNQQQFDALVSFSYNLGTNWTYSSSLKNILLNSYSGFDSSETKAVVEADGGLNLRESYTTNSKVLDVMSDGETVTIIDNQKYNSVWYKVRTQNGKTGYCSGTYLNILGSRGVGRDLNYVNKNALIKEMLAYHHAGGQCYYGLLYRRADELEMFLYGDYTSDGRLNKYNFPSPYCISF